MKNRSAVAPTTLTHQNDAGYIRRDMAAKYCGVSPRTISDWQRRRVIPYFKVAPKCVLFKCSDLDKALGRFVVEAVQ